MAASLVKAGVTRVGIEATGGYERGVVEHLLAAGFIVLVLQPVQVKAFGRVHLRRAKNDALDAELIAACTAAIDDPRIAPDPRLAEMAQNLTFLEQLEEDIARFKTRLEHIDEAGLQRLVNSDIVRLKARRATQTRSLAKRLRAHSDLARRFDLVLSIPGIGERTALALIIRMPELALSAARKPQPWPVSHPLMTIAASTRASVTLPAAEDACNHPCSQQRYRRPSAGTRL